MWWLAAQFIWQPSRSNLRKGKKNCKLIRENIPVYKLWIPTLHFPVSIKNVAKRLHLTQLKTG